MQVMPFRGAGEKERLEWKVHLEIGVPAREGLMIPVLPMCVFSLRHISSGVCRTSDATLCP